MNILSKLDKMEILGITDESEFDALFLKNKEVDEDIEFDDSQTEKIFDNLNVEE